jgi:hypothetical protein
MVSIQDVADPAAISHVANLDAFDLATTASGGASIRLAGREVQVLTTRRWRNDGRARQEF